MSALAAFGIVAGVATFAGVALAIFYGRREGSKRKILGYQAAVAPFPVASTTSLEEYDLSVVYHKKHEPPREIDSAFAHYVRFANFGREPIRRADLAPASPLRIEVAGTELLDATIVATRRDVCQIALGPIETSGVAPTAEEPERPPTAAVPVTFDFLDYQDGAVTRLLTTSRPDRVGLVGDIIGMPDGIKTIQELGARSRVWGPLGVTLAVLFEIAALVMTVFAYRWIVGEWATAWVMVLPLVALLGPIIVSGFVSETIWPASGPSFPAELRRRFGPPLHGPAFVDMLDDGTPVVMYAPDADRRRTRDQELSRD